MKHIKSHMQCLNPPLYYSSKLKPPCYCSSLFLVAFFFISTSFPSFFSPVRRGSCLKILCILRRWAHPQTYVCIHALMRHQLCNTGRKMWRCYFSTIIQASSSQNAKRGHRMKKEGKSEKLKEICQLWACPWHLQMLLCDSLANTSLSQLFL